MQNCLCIFFIFKYVVHLTMCLGWISVCDMFNFAFVIRVGLLNGFYFRSWCIKSCGIKLRIVILNHIVLEPCLILNLLCEEITQKALNIWKGIKKKDTTCTMLFNKVFPRDSYVIWPLICYINHEHSNIS